MTDILPPSPTKRKIIFVSIVSLCLLIVLSIIVFLSRSSQSEGGKGFNPKTKEVVIWTVNMPSTLFETLNKGYNDYLGRSDMKLKTRDFGSYEDMLDVLPRVVQAGAAPDVVLVPNHGGHMYLDPYIVALGENILAFDDFENRFHRLFVDELLFEEKQRVDGSDQLVRWLRWVPVGFEPLGIYYNRDLLSSTPTFWKDLQNLLTQSASENNVSAVSLGFWRATPESHDILPLLVIQNKGVDFNSYRQLNSIETRSTIEQLLKYRLAPNNLYQFQDAYQNTLTNVDLFVRGKVATLVGYPSLERDILLAIKRAEKDKEYDKDFEDDLRWTTIPQVEEDPKNQTNFARYMYFAMTKEWVNRNKEKASNDPVIKFMQYLATSDAQKTFFDNYEYYLPSQIALLAEPKLQINNQNGVFKMTIGDWYVATQKFVLYDKGIPHLFSYIVQKSLDEPGATATIMAGNMLSYMSCKINHLTDPDTYNRSCECLKDVQQNNNHYWPVCQWGV